MYVCSEHPSGKSLILVWKFYHRGSPSLATTCMVELLQRKAKEKAYRRIPTVLGEHGVRIVYSYSLS